MAGGRHADTEIRIAVIKKGDRGHSKNKTVTWSWLVDRLSSPEVDRKHTLPEYLDLPIDKQNRLKDVGAFVGGPFSDGMRKGTHLIERTVVTLDIDQATAEQIDDLRLGISKVCKYEFFASTTRKHTKKKPRWRLVFPVTRPVSIEEYGPLSRILASKVFATVGESMDAVDDVSYRPAQIMYWPSVCKDAKFEKIHNEGKLLNPDKVLEAFGDWQDWTKLPYSELRGKKRPTTGKKAENPTEKAGWIGAFCRAYDVERAIEVFLPDVYERGDEHSSKPRYTYAHGSSSNGAIIEDDGLFLYSHHGTDPCAERLVNAFDLVRIHKFGDMDVDCDDETPPAECPSFKEMIRFISDDPDVIAELAEDDEHLAPTKLRFENLGDDEDEPEPKKKKDKAKKADSDEDEEEDEDETPADEPDYTVMRQCAFDAPKFPLDVLGDFWGRRVQLWATNSSAPIDYTAMSAIVGAAAAIGNARWVQAKEGWKEPPVLWCSIIGRPSANKSPALNPLQNLFSTIEAEWFPEYEERIRSWQAGCTLARARKKAWETRLESVTAAKMEDENEFATLPEDCVEPVKPERRRVVISDITIESLMKTLASNPKGLLNLRDEMSDWFANMSRYNNGSDRPAWLEAYGGRGRTVDRVKNEGVPLFVPRFSVSMLGGLQPDRLVEFLRTSEDGLQARFMFVWPEGRPQPIGEGIPEDNGAVNAFRRLTELEMDVDDNGREAPVTVPLSKKAWERFKEWANKRPAEELTVDESIQSAFGKANGLVLRIALVLEFMRWSAKSFDPEPMPTRVSLKSINAAIRLREEYIKPMQIRVFSHVGKTEEERHAAMLGRWLLTHRPEQITVRQIMRESRIAAFRDAKAVNNVIEFMVGANWLTPAEKRSTAKGGRPQRAYNVNKKVYKHFDDAILDL